MKGNKKKYINHQKKGLINKKIKDRNRKIKFQKNAILLHLQNHESKDDYQVEANLDNLPKHLNWNEKKLNNIIYAMKNEGLITIDDNIASLTQKGKNNIKAFSEENFKS